ncbi:toprim domain-containing protein [Chryseobacterium suipulveris]|uniref:Toprim domain-containing protein n=1 Tax=Chryseobacterium suipulveris TaxID=2929800 RepID=A0ABY4BLT1_9FLAO|nr:toprim domain-containing protein [Chryseobacterium suipulveris]UOE40147.1 toprim domain-containing protein [Chryseobacterium suipulveris]
MNCKKANDNISIREILESFSLFPSKENHRTAFYFAIDREERTPSLSVDYNKNTAFDFGTGKKYDNVSIVQSIKRCSVSEALEYLERFDYSKPIQRVEKDVNQSPKSNYQILELKAVENPSLIHYLKSRKLESQISELKEIHYELNERNYFGIGFKNDSGGYEIRNPHVKVCLGKKDITSIKSQSETSQNQSQTLRIFEGFTDYLSFKILEQHLEKSTSDYLILNSVSMINRATDLVKSYPNIELYLDNDRTGNEVTEILNRRFPEAEDCRILYPNHKDLNEFITVGNIRKINAGREIEDLHKNSARKIGR